MHSIVCTVPFPKFISPLQISEAILGRLEAETVPFLLVRLQSEGVECLVEEQEENGVVRGQDDKRIL